MIKIIEVWSPTCYQVAQDYSGPPSQRGELPNWDNTGKDYQHSAGTWIALGEYPALPDSICVPLITLYGAEGRYTDLGSTQLQGTTRVEKTGKLSTSRYPFSD